MSKFKTSDASITSRTSNDGNYHIQEATIIDDKAKKLIIKTDIVNLDKLTDDIKLKLASGEYTVERL